MRTPLDVQNCRLVTTHQRRVSVHPAYLWVGGLGGLLKIDLQWCLGMKKKVVRQGVVCIDNNNIIINKNPSCKAPKSLSQLVWYGKMDRWMDGWMDGWMNGWMGGWMDV